MARHHRAKPAIRWVWVTMTLVPIAAIGAAVADQLGIAGFLCVAWLLALGFLMIRDVRGEMRLARREHEEHKQALRELEELDRHPRGKGETPDRRSWRARRLTVFRDWPVDPPLP